VTVVASFSSTCSTIAHSGRCGWESYFSRLDAHLAGGFLSVEDAHKTFPEVHERYAARSDSTGATIPTGRRARSDPARGRIPSTSP
jgi:hypothetical protein